MLQINHLTKIYPSGKRAVDDLTLSVEAGQICGFIGHNGAGKTTTLKAVAGVLDFDQGQILIAGHDVKTDALEAKKLTAYIPDDPQLYEHMTGIQYLNFIGDMFRVPLDLRRQRVEEYARMLELTDDLGSGISSYSHGMKQKLALISALMHEPKLLILDEPFVGLDPKASHTLKEQMQLLCQRGSAIFFSTHVLETAERLCDRVAIIKEGRLVASGTMEEVKGNSSLEDVFLELIDHE